MSSTETDRLMTVREAAGFLRLSPSTVYQKTESGELPVVRLGSGSTSLLRVPEDGLERYLDEHTIDAVGAV